MKKLPRMKYLKRLAMGVMFRKRNVVVYASAEHRHWFASALAGILRRAWISGYRKGYAIATARWKKGAKKDGTIRQAEFS